VTAIKTYRTYIVAVGIAILFFIAAHLFLTAYTRYVIAREKVLLLTGEDKLLKEQKRELERKNQILSQVGNFIDKADKLGLEKDRWAAYEVNIQEPVSFSEMEQILTQCTNSSSYYFKPIMLHVKKSSSTPAVSPDKKMGDVLLTLRGAFVVRHR
jgi:hypothetical protein